MRHSFFREPRAKTEPDPTEWYARSSYRPPVTSYEKIRPAPRSRSNPAKSGTTARPCMARPRFCRIIVDRRFALPSSESSAPSIFS
ncbi:Uncharacterised protein [Mycobacteroides abscessus]|nr:Uncharacterised protein [Mycobacteroides abscessus]